MFSNPRARASAATVNCGHFLQSRRFNPRAPAARDPRDVPHRPSTRSEVSIRARARPTLHLAVIKRRGSLFLFQSARARGARPTRGWHRRHRARVCFNPRAPAARDKCERGLSRQRRLVSIRAPRGARLLHKWLPLIVNYGRLRLPIVFTHRGLPRWHSLQLSKNVRSRCLQPARIVACQFVHFWCAPDKSLSKSRRVGPAGRTMV